MLYTIAETTHTPQGDGNSLVTALFTMSGETTYTPQGDGNSINPGQLGINDRNNSHPARGRPFGKEGSS